jgi:hypothetical protein
MSSFSPASGKPQLFVILAVKKENACFPVRDKADFHYRGIA